MAKDQPGFSFLKDDNGATLFEYTVLITIVLGGAVFFVPFVGEWVKEEWNAFFQTLDTACTLPSTATPCMPPGHTK